MKKGLRILLIDENAADRDLVKLLLSADIENLSFSEVDNPVSLVQAIESGHFDSAIIEYHFSWSDGFSLSALIREKFPRCPIIILTSSGDEETAIETYRRGFDAYLTKSSKHLLLLAETLQTLKAKTQQIPAIKVSEPSSSSLPDTIPIPLLRLNKQGIIISANQACINLLGYLDINGIEGASMVSFLPRSQDCELWQKATQTKDIVRDTLLQIRRKNGRIIWIKYGAYAVRDQRGDLLYYDACLEDVNELVQSNEKLQTSLNEKDLLLKEIYHRVKNNLQVIISLLKLQVDAIPEAAIREVYQKSINRVQSMALMHESLYKSKDTATLNIADYIHNLAEHLRNSYALNQNSIQLDIAADITTLGIEDATCCGLIINELVSNAIKHAFPNASSGRIEIKLKQDDNGQFTLKVCDNGIGLPPEIDPQNSPSLGLQIVMMLIEQIDGTLTIDRTEGTSYTIQFEEK